ncbi:hypothetical protein WN55_00457 [Dufourea novaeangliae]|uniref:Uncharacterized protein n=1 Tax=Dufourea novaeangliae TaxID=178035 RepID=A0A154PDA7_DUFNO|nr:hypothetical protein WN55_00457 [Dufourea novaeangliae]
MVQETNSGQSVFLVCGNNNNNNNNNSDQQPMDAISTKSHADIQAMISLILFFFLLLFFFSFLVHGTRTPGDYFTEHRGPIDNSGKYDRDTYRFSYGIAKGTVRTDTTRHPAGRSPVKSTITNSLHEHPDDENAVASQITCVALKTS